MHLTQKHYLIIAIVVILAIIVGGVSYTTLGSKKSQTSSLQTDQGQSAIQTLTPDDIGMTLQSARNGNAIMMNLNKLTGISAIDYEVTYTATGNIPRGVIGHIDIATTDSTKQQEIVLGTCSNVCHYDTGVQDIKFVLKVTKANGKVYQVNQTFSF